MNKFGTLLSTIGGALFAALLLLLAPLVASAEDSACAVCSCTGDRDGDGIVTVDEIIAAVNNALQGCPPLRWQPGCGPPVEGGQDNCPDWFVCTTERLGESCDQASAECCPAGIKCLGQQCNAPLLCATQPPPTCPVSRRAYKRDIQYLAPADIENLRQQLLAFKLARYQYKSEGTSGPAHLGFIIEDVEPSPAIDRRGDAVDLYGYLSMAVAALQAQSNDIEALKQEINDLRQNQKGLSRAVRFPEPAKK